MSRSNLGFLAGSITGHYRTVAASGLIAGTGANAPIFAFRMGSGYIRGLLQRFRMQLAITTPFTNVQELSVGAYVARSWSVADSGGTSLTLTGNNAMLNSLADTQASATINVATTGALTAGTRTLDAQPFIYMPAAQLFSGSSTTTQSSPFSEEYVLNSDQQYPLNMQSGTLFQSGITGQSVGTLNGPEGVVVLSNIALGAGGAVRFIAEIEWVEYDGRTSPGIAG